MDNESDTEITKITFDTAASSDEDEKFEGIASENFIRETEPRRTEYTKKKPVRYGLEEYSRLLSVIHR